MRRFFRQFREEDLLKIQSLEEIKTMHPLRFEWFCKYFLPYMGYKSLYVSKKKGSHMADGGVDLYGKFCGQKVLIQCKRLNKGAGGYVPVHYIRELGGCLKRDGIDRGALVATLPFSKTCYEEARDLNIELIGRDEIVATMQRINL